MKCFLTFLFFMCAFQASKATIVYVNINATGLNNGTSWTNAYTSLYSALMLNTGADTFWVANGVYKPIAPGSTTQSRLTSFQIVGAQKVFGGFAGNETLMSQRNWSTFQTILDGDIGTVGVYTDNSDHVVYIPGFNTGSLPAGTLDCRLDGFKVVNGYNYSHGYGGAAVYSVNYAVAIRVVITNCYFLDNLSTSRGGAISISSQGINEISNCTFESNLSGDKGGAIAVSPVQNWPNSKALTISDCTFKGDSASYGGAIAVLDSVNLTIARCRFSGNQAAVAGAAIYDTSTSKFSLYNSLLAGNRSVKGCAYYCPPLTIGAVLNPHNFIHNTIAHNKATTTAANDYALYQTGKDVIKNNIIWDNATGSSIQVAAPPSASTVSDNLIQGGVTGTTRNYTFNPQFVSAGAASAAPFILSGGLFQYHLKGSSQAIDTGTNLATTFPNNQDLDDLSRVFGRLPDLGCFERVYCTRPLTVTTSGPTTFCLPGSVTLTASSPGLNIGSYQWNGAAIGNVLTTSQSGAYIIIVADDTGCRNSQTIIVNATPTPNPVITQSGSTLSVPATYASYQWYKNGIAIVGATSPTYNPTTNGTYTVKVIANPGNCPGTSAVYDLHNLSTSMVVSPSAISVYPNPADALLNIEGAKACTYQVFDALGQLKANGYLSREKEAIDIGKLPAGCYVMRIAKDGVARSVARIMKR